MKLQSGVNKKARQASALERLETQLKSGVKPEKLEGRTTSLNVPLSEKDIKRIKAEIAILQAKV